MSVTGFVRYYLGTWQRAKAKEARADMGAFELGTVPYALLAIEVAMREAIAEGFDGLERYRRVRRLAVSYPITWETAQRYDKKHGARAAEVIELKLREARAL
jgi:hypothetical protein